MFSLIRFSRPVDYGIFEELKCDYEHIGQIQVRRLGAFYRPRRDGCVRFAIASPRARAAARGREPTVLDAPASVKPGGQHASGRAADRPCGPEDSI